MAQLKKQTAYRQFANEHAALPLYVQPFWLDAVCGIEGWDASIVYREGKVAGVWPYFTKKKLGITTINMPPLTPRMGPFLSYPKGQKHVSKASYECEIYTELLSDFPNIAHFNQYLHHSVTNWLPCYWKGFQSSVRYTYILKDLSNPEAVFNSFKGNIKTDIRKASKQLTCSFGEDLRSLLDIQRKTFERQNKQVPNSDAAIKSLDKACAEKGCREILIARDSEGIMHAGLYLAWDNQEVHSLMAGADPMWRSSGASSFLFWEAIKLASKMGRTLNFEGSMIERVEPFLRAFGGEQTPYFHIWHTKPKWLRLLRALRQSLM